MAKWKWPHPMDVDPFDFYEEDDSTDAEGRSPGQAIVNEGDEDVWEEGGIDHFE